MVILATAWCPTESLANWEHYSIRPNILQDSVKAIPHPELGPKWTDALRPAHLEFVAQMLELYPNQELYFLARDSELLYDFANLMTAGTSDHKRIHLINVSRANKNDPHLRDYLAQEGIHLEGLREGKEIIFIDTGFEGSIPAKIQELFPQEFHNLLKTHLICSGSEKHPSSRSFLQFLNPSIASLDPGRMHGTIIAYEHLPRYTDQSQRYEKFKGRWEATSRLGQETDGKVSKSKALDFIEDLKAFGSLPETRKRMEARRQFWRTKVLEARSGDIEAIRNSWERALKDHPKEGEIWVQDLEESFQKNMPSFRVPELDQLPGHRYGPFGIPLTEVIKVHPAWKKYLDNIPVGVKELVSQGQFQTLREILDVVPHHAEIRAEVLMNLKTSLDQPSQRQEVFATLMVMVKHGNNVIGLLKELQPKHLNEEFLLQFRKLNQAYNALPIDGNGSTWQERFSNYFLLGEIKAPENWVKAFHEDFLKMIDSDAVSSDINFEGRLSTVGRFHKGRIVKFDPGFYGKLLEYVNKGHESVRPIFDRVLSLGGVPPVLEPVIKYANRSQNSKQLLEQNIRKFIESQLAPERIARLAVYDENFDDPDEELEFEQHFFRLVLQSLSSQTNNPEFLDLYFKVIKELGNYQKLHPQKLTWIPLPSVDVLKSLSADRWGQLVNQSAKNSQTEDHAREQGDNNFDSYVAHHDETFHISKFSGLILLEKFHNHPKAKPIIEALHKVIASILFCGLWPEEGYLSYIVHLRNTLREINLEKSRSEAVSNLFSDLWFSEMEAWLRKFFATNFLETKGIQVCKEILRELALDRLLRGKSLDWFFEENGVATLPGTSFYSFCLKGYKGGPHLQSPVQGLEESSSFSESDRALANFLPELNRVSPDQRKKVYQDWLENLEGAHSHRIKKRSEVNACTSSPHEVTIEKIENLEPVLKKMNKE